MPERLSALDASFLQIETAHTPLHVGWTLRFEGSPPSLAALRRHIDGRLDGLPRFRRRVLTRGLRVLDPVWADDPHFDIAHHVDAVALPAPGGPEQLREAAGALLSGALDHDRPLWRLYLVTGLEGGFAIVGQAHHALVDGIAAVEVAMLLLDAEPRAAAAPRAGWRPEPEPGVGDLALATVAHRVRRSLDASRRIARAAASPQGLAAAAAEGVRDASAALEATRRPAPRSALNREIGARRAVAFARLGLAAARDAGRRRGATVNDVVLAASSLALGPYLETRGGRPSTFKVMVPVSLRPAGAGLELGNRISFLFVELPLGESDPDRTLLRIREQTRAQKEEHRERGLHAVTEIADLLPNPARLALARLTSRALSFNAVISNIPGPDQPLHLLGRRLTAAFPAVPLDEGHALTIGVLGYCGALHAGLYADAATLPDVVDLARRLESAFDALCLATPPPTRPGPTPWRRRAEERRAAAARAGQRGASR